MQHYSHNKFINLSKCVISTRRAHKCGTLCAFSTLSVPNSIQTKKSSKKRAKNNNNNNNNDYVERKPSEKMRLLIHCALHQNAAVLQHQHESSQKGTQTKQKLKKRKNWERERMKKNAQPKRSTKYNIRINCFRFH